MKDALGRLVVDLESVLAGSVADVLLEDGDSIHIPATRQSVSVVGEVFAANSHLFKNDLTLQDYVDLSGGANDYADISNTYLIKADGSIISPSQLASGSRFFRNSLQVENCSQVIPSLCHLKFNLFLRLKQQPKLHKLSIKWLWQQQRSIVFRL